LDDYLGETLGETFKHLVESGRFLDALETYWDYNEKLPEESGFDINVFQTQEEFISKSS